MILTNFNLKIDFLTPIWQLKILRSVQISFSDLNIYSSIQHLQLSKHCRTITAAAVSVVQCMIGCSDSARVPLSVLDSTRKGLTSSSSNWIVHCNIQPSNTIAGAEEGWSIFHQIELRCWICVVWDSSVQDLDIEAVSSQNIVGSQKERCVENNQLNIIDISLQHSSVPSSHQRGRQLRTSDSQNIFW